MKQYCQHTAHAAICGGEGNPGLRGRMELTPCCGGTMVTVRVRGLPRSETGFFALHIHNGGDCGGEGFANTGTHLNPNRRDHPMHMGDLPPLMSCKGRAVLSVFTDRFRPEQVIGKTVVIHSGPDDFYTQPAGNAGIKIACGVIKRG